MSLCLGQQHQHHHQQQLAARVKYAEWWAHTRPHASGHALHFDTDEEGLREDGARFFLPFLPLPPPPPIPSICQSSQHRPTVDTRALSFSHNTHIYFGLLPRRSFEKQTNKQMKQASSAPPWCPASSSLPTAARPATTTTTPPPSWWGAPRLCWTSGRRSGTRRRGGRRRRHSRRRSRPVRTLGASSGLGWLAFLVRGG